MVKITRKVEIHVSKIILLGWMIVLMEACTPVATPATSQATSPAESAAATAIQGVGTQMNPSETPSSPSRLETLIEMVKADLAQRLSLTVEQINVVDSVEVEWSDSSLDCPQPDMLYTQVITPGYRILLEVNGQQYEYHSNRDAYFVYCENPGLPPIPKP